jgi:hypothetical protein
MKGNVVQTLVKASKALAFFPLAMQGWCIFVHLGDERKSPS